MAKKSKKSNMRALWDFVTLVLAGLLLGFMALPQFSWLVVGETIYNRPGYDLISFEDGANTGLSVVLLLLVIFAALLALFAILKLLADLGVVKSSGFNKFATFGLLLSAIAVAVLVIVNCIVTGTYCDGKADPITEKVTGRVANWATLIVNAVIGVVSLITSALTMKK